MSKKNRIKITRVPATTNNITKAIIGFLLSEGHSASRVNVQGQWDDRLQIWRPSGSRKGFLDVSACIRDSNGVGRYCVFDVKKGKDTLSDDQKEFIVEVEGAGGIAIEIESYDYFKTWYTNYIKTI